jgi:aryl-alcohol dehydrogenase-like predicted oxidoreductase
VKLGTTELDVFPLCLGGNVFGWTADEQQSFAVLDEYAAAGGNFIDTADVYAAWVPGNSGGESETIIGRWLAARRNRDQMVIATKVGCVPSLEGLSAKTIRAAAEASLQRLGTGHIDLYYAHCDDADTSLEETLSAFDALICEGWVRHVAASNYSATRLAEALAVSRREGLAPYVAVQPHYNLMERDGFEGDLAHLCAREGLDCLPYYALAKGFLTGKYRAGTAVASARAEEAGGYLDERGMRVLAVLDGMAAEKGTSVAAVALAWLLAQPNVAAPVASARTPDQLAELLPSATLHLSQDDLVLLDQASGRRDAGGRVSR